MVVSDVHKMEFSRELGSSSDGHKSLIQLNESEIKLWEGIRSYVDKRAKIDMEYADKINKLQQSFKLDMNSSEANGMLEKAWKTFVNESENKAISMAIMAKNLQSNVLYRLERIVSSKKEFLKKYKQDRSRFDMELSCSQDEVKRLGDNYRSSLKEFDKIKEKLDEVSNKEKGDKEWKKSKERLDKTCLKLHMNHNDYVLAIKVANEHQTMYHGSIIPYLLSSVQDIQEDYINEMKDILAMIHTNANWCKDEFLDSSKHIENSIKLIDTANEYMSFINNHKKAAQPIFPYFFEETLHSDNQSQVGLVKNELALNDLTHEQLKYKLATLDKDHESAQKELKLKEEAVKKVENDFGDMTNENQTMKTCSMNVLEKKSQLLNLRREITHIKCREGLIKAQSEILNDKIAQLGEAPPPCYIKFETNYSEEDKSRKVEKDRSKSLNVDTNKKLEKKKHTSFFSPDKKRPSSVHGGHHDVSECEEEFLGDYVEPMEDVPLSSEPWFHGSIDRKAAEKLLKYDGDFLVREKSDGSGAFVVSVMCQGLRKHFLMTRTEDGKFKFEADAFKDVNSLIYFHQKNSIPIKNADNVRIINPIRKAFSEGDKFSYPSDNVRIDVRLGNGHFGDVFKGMLLKQRLPVAIKTCREGVDEIVKRKFLEEAEIMKPYDHPNVVKLIGICNDREPFMILMELMPYGDLLNHLKKTGSTLGVHDLLRIGIDAAKGMAYLESHNTIHRDLAARNVLIGENHVAKISDFGMSREEDNEGIYTMQTTKEIPVKWTAPEVWHYHQYTSKSDVWSFGILLWEIFSIGNVPYPGWNNKRTKDMIETGYRLPLPTGTPLKVYDVMSQCWQYEPEKRPNFSQIERALESL